MANIFEIRDKTGRIISLSDEGWTHIAMKHPNLGSSIECIKETLCQPLFLNESPMHKGVMYYHRQYKELKKYLVVVVKYLNGKGFIISSFYTTKAKP